MFILQEWLDKVIFPIKIPIGYFPLENLNWLVKVVSPRMVKITLFFKVCTCLSFDKNAQKGGYKERKKCEGWELQLPTCGCEVLGRRVGRVRMVLYVVWERCANPQEVWWPKWPTTWRRKHFCLTGCFWFSLCTGAKRDQTGSGGNRRDISLTSFLP